MDFAHSLSALSKLMVRGLIEVDVARARAFLREHKANTGESLSFTAFIVTCLAHAVDENKSVQACRKGRKQVRTLDQYRAVVLGAPLYMFRWHKDALNFLARHRAALTARPVAIFVLGPFHNEEKEYQEVREQLNKELAKFPWLTPAAIEIFGGKFDPQKLTFPHNLLPALKNMPASDIRDWTAIRAWANDLAAQFQPALA